MLFVSLHPYPNRCMIFAFNLVFVFREENVFIFVKFRAQTAVDTECTGIVVLAVPVLFGRK